MSIPLYGTRGVRTSATLFGHPTGLTFLFLTGMWEVVALFGMKTILVFYLVHQRHFSPSEAVQIFGLSTGGSFLMSLLGGIAADRLLGMHRAVFVGALTLAAAHFFLMAPALLFPSLFFIAVGSGLFRPALVGLVVTLYGSDDPRRPRALLLYKLGCNIGGVIGPLICGLLYETVGWTAAVTFCSLGMLIAAGIFLVGQPYLMSQSAATPKQTSTPNATPPGTVHPVIIMFTIGLGAILHWTVASQQGGTLALWAYDSLDRTARIGTTSFLIPAAWFQSINPVLIMILTPFIAALWARSSTGIAVEIRRMTFGSLALATAFAILCAAGSLSGAKPNWTWLVVAMIPITAGEIYLETMGQAMFSRLGPQRLLSTVISLWFLTIAAGNLAAGWLGGLWGSLRPPLFFAICAALALVSAGLIAGSRFFIRGASEC
jgi:proton-dependent oligopeptide transporter, POT family